MMLKTRKSPGKKQLNKTASNASLRLLKKHKSKEELLKKDPRANDKQKDCDREQTEQSKLKKRIESMQTPELLLKIHYKGKKLSVPLQAVEEKGLKELVGPFIQRFQTEILKNKNFDPACIQNWRTVGAVSILKDYYFQLDRSMAPFKGEVVDIQPIMRAKYSKVLELKDFQVLKCIGTGGFSKVFLARRKATGKFYALKVMQKEGLAESGRECVVTNERDIMGQLDHPRILRMQFAFETKGFVVFALEYCPGGELFYYLRKVRRMDEDHARFCFVQILTAFQYLHSKGVVYRDVKPQNILIDADGHLKLADFGLSRAGIGKDQLAYTYCGSPEYMAPEMLKKTGHSYPVDYYCLGALLYELVTGNPPFYSRDVDRIYHSIEHEEIEFPQHIQISSQLQMLLNGLLVKDPLRRLGSLGGIREILSHPWVRKLKPADVLEGRVPTPIQVDLMAFNINEQEIGDAEQKFQQRIRHEQKLDASFEPMFQDFYFSRDNPNVLEGLENQSKTGGNNSKMNITLKRNPKSKDNNIGVMTSKDKMARKLKSSKRLANCPEVLVERGRKRNDKSIPMREKKKQRPQSPKFRDSKILKRVKSSDALIRPLPK